MAIYSPQRGFGLQPRVADSGGYPGKKERLNPSTATRLRLLCGSLWNAKDATALRLRIIVFLLPQRSRGGNVGLEDTAPLGQLR